MKILLIGYGKMGKAIEGVAISRGHEIVDRIDIGQKIPSQKIADVAIEFTHPDAAVDNIKACITAGIPVVCGTTGWYHRKAEIEQFCKEKNGAFFTASNFSLGVNLFFKLNKYLAQLMEPHRNYDVSIDETHHTQKKDAPSGTAITLAEGILGNLTRKKKWVNETSTNAEELVIKSFRVDPAPGTHVVKYQSTIDDFEIKHTAHSREGFAWGAVLAAEWLPGKKGVFTMDDLLKL